MNTPLFVARFGVIVFAVGMAVPAEARQVAVTAQELPTLGSPLGIAAAINSDGDIVGVSGTADGKLRAALWSDGGVTNLGALCDTCYLSVAYDINDHGQIVGYSQVAGGATKPFVHTGGVMTELPLPAGVTTGLAISITDDGRIVGYGFAGSAMVGILWPSPVSAPETINLAVAASMNSAGDIAGAVTSACGQLQAAVLHNGVAEPLEAGAGCVSSTAWAINASGLIAGDSVDATGTSQATVWENGVRTLLAPLPGFLSSGPGIGMLNDSGDVVGVSVTQSGVCWSQGTAWLPEGTVALPSPSLYQGACEQSTAIAINKNAQVVGVYNNASSYQMPILWTLDVDRQPPVVTAVAADDTIAPPNGKMVPVTFAGTMTDASGVSSATFSIVDEYGVVQPSGSIAIGGSGGYSVTVMLEAKRDPKDKDGRTYTFTATGSDPAGRSASASATAAVRVGGPKK